MWSIIVNKLIDNYNNHSRDSYDDNYDYDYDNDNYYYDNYDDYDKKEFLRWYFEKPKLNDEDNDDYDDYGDYGDNYRYDLSY